MIKERGSCRLVLLVGSIAVKVAWPQDIEDMARLSWRFLISFRFRLFWKSCKICAIDLRKSIRVNWDEFVTWRKVRSDFLMPTYFSIGFVSIQKRSFGERLAFGESLAIFLELRKVVGKLNIHQFVGSGNYRRTPGGYVMVDYGNPGGYRTSNKIIRYKKEFLQVLNRGHYAPIGSQEF